MSTLYASFADSSIAERAAGALMDHGAEGADLSLIANSGNHPNRVTTDDMDAIHAEKAAKTGISTTSAGDVAIGTMKGMAIGGGVGIAAILASLFIPGVGLVLGGGALATAMAGAAGTALAGAAAGGVTGYLVDQGVPDEMVTKYSDTFYAGGAILALAVPSGDLTGEEAEAILSKYGAINVAIYNMPRVNTERGAVVSRPPIVVQSTNSDVQPVMIVDDYATPPVTVVDPQTGAVTSEYPIAPTVVTKNAVTGEAVVEREMIVPNSRLVEPTEMATVHMVTDAATGKRHAAETHSIPPANAVIGGTPVETAPATVVTETPVTTFDPVTGEPRSGVQVTQRQAVVATPTVIDSSGQVLDLPEGLSEPVVVEKTETVIDD